MNDSNEQRDLLGFIVNDKNNVNDYGFTRSQQKAFDVMKSGRNCYICGPAGTGKSYLIACFTDYCKKHNIPLMVCAPTGMAAREINGETCHAAFKLDIGPIFDKEKETPYTRPRGKPIQSLMESAVILIDEVSMLRIDVFDCIIAKVSHANRKRKELVEKYLNGSSKERRAIEDSKWKLSPIQMILVGDFYQLPPVIKDEDRKVLERVYGSKLGNCYAFMSDHWHSYAGGFETVRLTEIVRQRHDREFTTALNKIRKGDFTGAEYITEHSSDLPFSDGIWLYGTKKAVARENKHGLESLPGKTKKYEMRKTGNFSDADLVADPTLILKVGARVMSLMNDRHGERYVNGSLGTVKKLLKDLITVKFDNGYTIDIDRYKWEVYGYDVADGKLVHTLRGTYEQFPLRLAYALTIHKSQGQTFDKVNISTETFAAGQLYVGLSRVKSVENMYIAGYIDDRNLIVDHEVQRFDRRPKEYRFFDKRGGARKGAGRKPNKEGRGPTQAMRIPVRYKSQINDFMVKLDEIKKENLDSVKPMLIPDEYVSGVKKFIEELKKEEEKGSE